MDKVGKDGTITVEEAKGIETSSRRCRRYAVRQGLPLSILLHRQQSLWKFNLEDAYILIHEKKISNFNDLLPILQSVC